MRQLKITKQVTNRETASLDKYLQEIGKVDLITADQEVELAQRIKAGDQVALERLTKAKTDYLRLSKLENKFSQLQREVDTNKELYNNYLVRLKEADAMGNYNANFYVRFIDKAVLPKVPFAPRKGLLVIVSFVLALILTSIYVIMRELLVDTLNSRRKLDTFHEAPILAVLPKFKYKQSSESDKYVVDNRFTEAVRTSP